MYQWSRYALSMKKPGAGAQSRRHPARARRAVEAAVRRAEVQDFGRAAFPREVGAPGPVHGALPARKPVNEPRSTQQE